MYKINNDLNLTKKTKILNLWGFVTINNILKDGI